MTMIRHTAVCRMPLCRVQLAVLAILTGLTLADKTAAAHPFHATLAEMEWNPASQRFEVALQLPGVEIEEELSLLHGRRINLETMPETERLLQDYVRQHFRVTDARHDACRIHWVGSEVEFRSVWVYFEVELTEGSSPSTSEPESGLSPAQRPVRETSLQQPEKRPAPLTDLKIRVTILTETRQDQVNFVNVTNGQTLASAQLTAEESEARLTFRKKGLRIGQPTGSGHTEGR